LRRILFTLVTSALLVAAIPATALGRSHHARSHHRSHHSRTHHSVRHKQFGRATAPTTTAPSDNAGTVASFDPATNKLTIALNDGSTVTGTVTPDTQIECDSTSTSNMGQDFAFRKNDHSGGGDNGDQGDNQGNSNDQGDNDDQGGQGDNDDNNAQSCSTADLPGAVVHEAELRISSAGSTWDKVDLVNSSSSSSSSSSSGD
jgi:hypothetical protein